MEKVINFQVDYCLKELFKSTIIPKNQISPQIEELNNDPHNIIIPLSQGIIFFHRTKNKIISINFCLKIKTKIDFFNKARKK